MSTYLVFDLIIVCPHALGDSTYSSNGNINIVLSIFQEFFSGNNQYKVFNIYNISTFYLLAMFLGSLWGKDKEIYDQFTGEEHKNLDQRIP